eukprot:gene10419-1889_t
MLGLASASDATPPGAGRSRGAVGQRDDDMAVPPGPLEDRVANLRRSIKGLAIAVRERDALRRQVLQLQADVLREQVGTLSLLYSDDLDTAVV